MTQVVRLVLVALVALATSSCLHDLFRSGIPLTETEVIDVFLTLTQSVAGTAEYRPIQSLRTVTTPCSKGDITIDYSEVVTEQASERTVLAFNYRAHPNDCSTLSWGGPNITFSGDPNLAGEARIITNESTGHHESFYISSAGGFRYVTDDGRDGSCELSIAYTWERSPAGTFTVWQGTACGFQIAHSE